MTGRKPIPASLINAKDHKKSKQAIETRQAAEAQLQTTAILRCPSYLTKEAKKEWRRVMKLYRQMEADILSDLDQAALVIYCEAWSIYIKAQETWARYNQVVAGNKDGQNILDKCLFVMEKQQKQISSMSEQLCLTPVGRARMGTAAKPEQSALSRLFDD